jgi:hypothetical protein
VQRPTVNYSDRSDWEDVQADVLAPAWPSWACNGDQRPSGEDLTLAARCSLFASAAATVLLLVVVEPVRVFLLS